MKHQWLWALTSCTALVAQAAAEPEPKIGLALSGGGTKGGAHVGVLKVLEKHGVRVDYIAGTSVGAIIGGMYASGMSPEDIEDAIGGIDWADILRDEPRRQVLPAEQKRDDLNYLVSAKPGFKNGKIRFPLGLAQGQKITQFLRRELAPVTGIAHFDDLPIPFRAVATSLANGEAVVIERGDLPSAIRASMSIPGALAPVELNGERLIDGGIANNLPIDIVRRMGADIVIAVDISAPYLKADSIISVFGVSQQITNFLTRRNVAAQVATLRDEDILIAPPFAPGLSVDFENALATAELGIAAAEAQAGRIAALGRQRTPPPVASTPARPPVIEFIDVSDDSGLSRKAVAARLDIPLNEPLDRGVIESGIQRLYGSGLYQSIDYKVIEVNGRTGILVNAKSRPWGPNYLQFGLRFEEDFSADADFNIGLAYQRTALNGLGASWRTQVDLGGRQGISTEWYQPLSYGGRFFSRALLEYERRNLRVFDANGDALADLRVAGTGVAVSVGAYTERASTLDLQWKRLIGTADVFIGQILPPADSFEIAEMSLNYEYDSLNFINRPSAGLQARGSAIFSHRSVGAEEEYEQLLGFATKALSLGEFRTQISLHGGMTRDKNAPLQSLFSLGGLGRLSGLPVDRFFGQHFALARINVSRSIRDSWTLPTFAGFSVESGNVWDAVGSVTGRDWLVAGSVYAGTETFIGPVYLAWGIAEGGDNAVYLYLGNPFLNRPSRPFD